MSATPWYKRYPSDFITGTLHLPLEVKGAYSMVLDLIYDRGGPIPDDSQWIARVCGCSTRKWNQIRDHLIEDGKIKVKDGRISNRRAVDQAKNGRTSSDNLAENSGENRAKVKEQVAENRTESRNSNDLASESAPPLTRSQKLESEESPHTPRKRGTRSLSKSEEAEFEAWWETYPHKVGKAAARSAWRSARGKAGLDDLLAGVARYVATKPPDRPWANPATWLNQERWADQPAGTVPPARTAAEREASNVLTFEDIYDRRQAALLARVERWIAGEEWDERCESIRPDKGLINLPDRLLDPMRADIERRGAECQAAEDRARWDENKAWVRKKAAAGADPAPQVFDRLRDDAAAHKQFGCTRDGLRQFIVETCAKAGLATAAEGMSFSPPAQQQGAAR